MAQQILHATFNQDATCVPATPLRLQQPAARADVSVVGPAPPLAAPQLPGGGHARRLPHLQHRGACAASRARAAEPLPSHAAVQQRAAVALFASAPSHALRAAQTGECCYEERGGAIRHAPARTRPFCARFRRCVARALDLGRGVRGFCPGHAQQPRAPARRRARSSHAAAMQPRWLSCVLARSRSAPETQNAPPSPCLALLTRLPRPPQPG